MGTAQASTAQSNVQLSKITSQSQSFLPRFVKPILTNKSSKQLSFEPLSTSNADAAKTVIASTTSVNHEDDSIYKRVKRNYLKISTDPMENLILPENINLNTAFKVKSIKNIIFRCI